MKKASEWLNTAFVAVGDATKKRKCITTAIGLGIAGVLTFQAVMNPLSSFVDPQVQAKGGIPYEQLVSHMDSVGQRINKMYGTENRVILYHDDANLGYILANAKEGALHEMSDVAMTSYVRNALYSAADLAGLDVNQSDMNRNNTYDNLHSDLEGPYVSSRSSDAHGMYEQPRSPAFLKGWSNNGFDQIIRFFPYLESKEELNTSAFFHELTHTVDYKDYKPTVGLNYEDVMIGEAIADLGSALISLKQTGNLDTWNFVTRTQRLTNATDVGHATAEIVDNALADITADSIKGLSDREIMLYAKDRAVQTMDSMFEKNLTSPNGNQFSEWNKNLWTHTLYSEPWREDGNLVNIHQRRLNAVTDGMAQETVRDFSRKAMEASLNNLSYHNSLDKYSSEFIKSATDHAKRFDDTVVFDALKSSMKGDKFDYENFASKVGLKVDFEAGARHDRNIQAMSSYFTSITERPANVGFEENSMPMLSNASMTKFGLKTDKMINELGKKVGAMISPSP